MSRQWEALGDTGEVWYLDVEVDEHHPPFHFKLMPIEGKWRLFLPFEDYLDGGVKNLVNSSIPAEFVKILATELVLCFFLDHRRYLDSAIRNLKKTFDIEEDDADSDV